MSKIVDQLVNSQVANIEQQIEIANGKGIEISLIKGRSEELFYGNQVRALIVNEILNEGDSKIERDAKLAASRIKSASDVLADAYRVFDLQNALLTKKQESIANESKKHSQNVRKAANDLSDGLQRIEKLANFDRLEKYVALLERAASAITILAEIEKSGKLEKIASSLR
jgi:uncharacterized Ntn-hydrolase superfamily protein